MLEELTLACQATALATAGGGSRIRTGDILLAKQTLYQLSYTPDSDSGFSFWLLAFGF